MIKRWIISVLLFALCWAGLPDRARSQQACVQPICFQNTSKFIGGGRWDWTVFVDPRSRDVAVIKCVEYTLHPTFPNPVRVVCDIGSIDQPFALRSNGWGTFLIRIRVLMKDGNIRELSHQLHLGPP